MPPRNVPGIFSSRTPPPGWMWTGMPTAARGFLGTDLMLGRALNRSDPWPGAEQWAPVKHCVERARRSALLLLLPLLLLATQQPQGWRFRPHFAKEETESQRGRGCAHGHKKQQRVGVETLGKGRVLRAPVPPRAVLRIGGNSGYDATRPGPGTQHTLNTDLSSERRKDGKCM